MDINESTYRYFDDCGIYLASKVHCSTQHEFKKLMRVIGYLKKYPRMNLKIKGDELFQKGVLNVWVDAAWGGGDLGVASGSVH